VRQYAEEKLALSPAADEAARGSHCTYYALALQTWEAELRGPRQREALMEMAADVDNAREAWEWAVDKGNTARIAQALDGICRVYERQGRFQEAETASRMAVDRLTGMKNGLRGDGLRVLARAWAWQGLFNRALGHTGLARQLLQRGLALLESLSMGEREPVLSSSKEIGRDRAFFLEQLGHTAYLSDRQEAARYWQQSLALYRALGDSWAAANVLTAFGHMCLDIGQQGRARHMYEESLALQRSLGDRSGIANTLLGLCYAANQQGRLEEAEGLAREAIAIQEDTGDRVGTARARSMLSATLVHLGRYAEAHRLLEEVTSLQEELGMRTALAAGRGMLAWVKVNLGLYSEAHSLGQDSLAVVREASQRGRVGMRLLCLGEIALAEGTYSEARHLLQESATLLREIGQGYELALALMELGHAERALGRPVQARRCLREGLRAIAHIEAHASSLYSLSLASLILADQGEVERAIELYALAMRHPAAANSRYWEDAAGKHIAAMAATLSPEIVARARARGRTRDLTATVAELLIELESAPEGE
jgi:tetratricopeptide (TPR) repeat protein